ncbi:MAG TPA: DUF4350 domain-containing protein [Solirubrobacter sp.]
MPRDGRVRVALGIGAFLLLFAVVLLVVDRFTQEPKGPPSSSYATTPQGLAAYASVLQRSGHPVRRLRTRISDDAPPIDQTLVVLDPDVMEPEEARAIGDWVRRGGRLVAGGAGDASWLDEVLDAPPTWEDGGGARRRTLVPAADTAGVREVASRGGGWHDLGGTLPLIGPANGPLLVTTREGEGEVALLADATPLRNEGLDLADGAALGIALAGNDKQTVAFLETVHGYGVSRGFGGLPAQVKWALLGLALTALIAVWSAGRRFGPPEDPDSEPPPPRVAYVDALAAALVRAKPEKDKERSS